MHPIAYAAVAALAASTLFALLTNSLRHYSMLRLEERFADAGRQKDLERFLHHEDALVLTATIWRLMANLVFVLLVAFYARSLASVAQLAAAGFVAAVALLVFGAAVPMAWAKYNAERVIVRTLPMLLAIRAASWPALAFLGLFDGLVRRLSGVPDADNREDELESELLSVVKEGELEGTFEEDEKEMIESIIEFKDTDVAEIMTPRTDMASLPYDAPLAQVRELVVAEGHSRVPVYQENLDTIVGVLYAKDLLSATGMPDFASKRVSDIMRSPLFIPETRKLTDLLHDFRREGVHIAIVLDEYGGTAGLVTIEDVVEEIFGEITDEYDETETEEIRRLSETAAEIDAQTRIGDINDELNIELPEEEDYETVGGFVFSQLGFIPKPGERFEYRGLAVTVLQADERRVKRVRLEGLDRFVRDNP